MMIHTAGLGFVRLMNSSISQQRFVFLVMLRLSARQNTGPVLVVTPNRSEIFFWPVNLDEGVRADYTQARDDPIRLIPIIVSWLFPRSHFCRRGMGGAGRAGNNRLVTHNEIDLPPNLGLDVREYILWWRDEPVWLEKVTELSPKQT